MSIHMFASPRSNACHAFTASYRRLASTSAKTTILKARTPAAKKLLATGFWSGGKAAKKQSNGSERVTGDKSRVNIVDKALCSSYTLMIPLAEIASSPDAQNLTRVPLDDILNVAGSSLRRHFGCDLLDINPGAGVWSLALNCLLKPRRHLLLEPDHELYSASLAPLLTKAGVKLIPKSGTVWSELQDVLCEEYLPEQHALLQRQEQLEPAASSESTGLGEQRNDTLLVTANLCAHPRQRIGGFDSMAKLILHKFLTAVQSSSLFHRYGLVRMLLWVPDDDKTRILPRCAQDRRAAAIQAELTCEWITEWCGLDSTGDGDGVGSLRDAVLDEQSARQVLHRMREAGIKMPTSRETALFRCLNAPGEFSDQFAALDETQSALKMADISDLANGRNTRADLTTLLRLQQSVSKGKRQKSGTDHAELTRLRYKLANLAKVQRQTGQLLDERDDIVRKFASGALSQKELADREAALNARVEAMPYAEQLAFTTRRDNRQLFAPAGDGPNSPALFWDRRPFEPLAIRNDLTEFFPNVPCALLDVQPKQVHALLRQTDKSSQISDRSAADYFDVLLPVLMRRPTEPLRSLFDTLWPDAAEVVDRCPSLSQPADGGVPFTGWMGLCPRTLRTGQWMELLEQWMQWEFRPGWADLVRRLGLDVAKDGPEDDDGQAE